MYDNIGEKVKEYTLKGLMPENYYDECETIFDSDFDFESLSEMDDDEYENFLDNLPEDIKSLNIETETLDNIRDSGCFEDVYAEDYLNKDFIDWLEEQDD